MQDRDGISVSCSSSEEERRGDRKLTHWRKVQTASKWSSVPETPLKQSLTLRTHNDTPQRLTGDYKVKEDTGVVCHHMSFNCECVASGQSCRSRIGKRTDGS